MTSQNKKPSWFEFGDTDAVDPGYVGKADLLTQLAHFKSLIQKEESAEDDISDKLYGFVDKYGAMDWAENCRVASRLLYLIYDGEITERYESDMQVTSTFAVYLGWVGAMKAIAAALGCRDWRDVRDALAPWSEGARDDTVTGPQLIKLILDAAEQRASTQME